MEPGLVPGFVFPGGANSMQRGEKLTGGPCPVCGATVALWLGEKKGHAYLRCASCALVYARDVPTREQFAAVYGAYGGNRPSVGRQRFRLWPLVAWARQRACRAGVTRPLRALDVGCNTGYNTAALAGLGSEAHGLETNPATVELARSLHPDCQFHAETLEQHAASGQRYDAIYCSEVIEHAVDVRSFATALAALLEPHGLLFLTTPDAGHWRVPANTVRWRHVIPVEHLRLFDRRNLGRLLGEVGLEVRLRIPTTRTNLRLFCTPRV
jgi:2-polyprenyl-3-methyl-5-hydroxy-6-metoxy-1,4-benzoquinol methylase